MDNRAVPWRFKRPPYFLVLIVLTAGLGGFQFAKTWTKSGRIPAISADHSEWTKKIGATTNPDELRQIALRSQERSARAEHMADTTVTLVRSLSRSGLIMCALVLAFSIALYLGKRWV